MNAGVMSRAKYTLEFKQEAVRQVKAGRPAAAVVSPEQAEIARLKAEVSRLKMERDIAKKAAAYFAQDVLQSTPGFTR
jgi:transposase